VDSSIPITMVPGPADMNDVATICRLYEEEHPDSRMAGRARFLAERLDRFAADVAQVYSTEDVPLERVDSPLDVANRLAAWRCAGSPIDPGPGRRRKGLPY
jgi:hypothetical protein